ncbi:interferon-inducible GTPase 1-like [Amblyraja radiata]|uniref:interferon-inducible GTPase 1-like n=1 Tax=Amblyraja radiata TaxID=386614 RepID=UPI00140331C5|nr:interferon-inducible GTPase 1-like [Amblyraja radiata]
MANSCRKPDMLVFDSDIVHRWAVFKRDFEHYIVQERFAQKQAIQKRSHDKSCRPLPRLFPNQVVRMRSPSGHYRLAVVVGSAGSPRSYLIDYEAYESWSHCHCYNTLFSEGKDTRRSPGAQTSPPGSAGTTGSSHRRVKESQRRRMGNDSSSQQAAQSETPSYFTQEELNKLKSDFETGGVEKVKHLLQKKVKELDNTELNIAVTGDTGAGKSSFINAMRVLRSEDVGAAAVGTTETTMEPTGYPHPNLPNVRYWDLPGIGTTRFTAGTYLEKMQFQKYDFFIIVAAGRFRENDAKLAKEIKRLGKEFYFVRSKLDFDLNSMRQQREEFDEEAEMENMRSDCVSRLGKAGIPDPKVFLISSFNSDMYDFPRFMKTLEDGLPNIKKSVFVLVLPNLQGSRAIGSPARKSVFSFFGGIFNPFKKSV